MDFAYRKYLGGKSSSSLVNSSFYAAAMWPLVLTKQQYKSPPNVKVRIASLFIGRNTSFVEINY
jgi:hypothetical protein